MGSSRAKHQIDPAQLTVLGNNGYNIGINGVGTVYNYILLKLLLKNNVHLKTIVFETDVENYYDIIDDKADKKELQLLYPYTNEDTTLQKYLKKLGPVAVAISKINLYKYNGKFFNIMYNYAIRNSVKPNNGFAPLLQTIKPEVQSKSYTAPYYKGFSKNKINALKEMVQLCAKENINLFIVFPPYFQNKYFNAIETETLLKQLNFLDQKQIINYSNVNTCAELNNYIYWKDDRHLNKNGALFFSKLLNIALTSKQ
jgi:hypothetical protein